VRHSIQPRDCVECGRSHRSDDASGKEANRCVHRVGGSVPQYVRRRLAESVAAANIRERRSRIGVPREILQINDVAFCFACGYQGGHSERVGGDVRIELEEVHVGFDPLLHCPPVHWPLAVFNVSLATRRAEALALHL
jgi:Zn ribbon nucleic-acid-binding protein